MGKIYTAGPNKAIIVCGRGGHKSKKVAVGSWVYVPPLICNTQSLSLTLMTLTLHCQDVITSEGVPLDVIGIAQCKVINSPECLLIAAEHFLGRNIWKIETSILQTLEGHLRTILSSQTVEEVVRKGEEIVLLVCEEVSADFTKMGVQIISFVIRDISDNVGYLKSLGKKRTAEVKRDAAVGVALAERDAGIREAECEKEAYCIKYEVLSNLLRYSRLYYLGKYSYDQVVTASKVEAHLAYQLAKAKLRQKICLEELSMKMIEVQKEIEIEQREVKRKNIHLIETVKNLRLVENYQMQTVGDVEKAVVIQNMINELERFKHAGKMEGNKMKCICLMEALFRISEKGLCF